VSKRVKTWTEGSLLLACRRILSQPDTKLYRDPNLDSRDCAARSTWSYDDKTGEVDNVKIVIDHTQSGDVQSVLHELLHVVLDRSLQHFNGTIQEEIIYCLEKHLYNKISNSHYKMRSWRKLIASKVVQGKESNAKSSAR
jgi:hypothetical protein